MKLQLRPSVTETAAFVCIALIIIQALLAGNGVKGAFVDILFVVGFIGALIFISVSLFMAVRAYVASKTIRLTSLVVGLLLSIYAAFILYLLFFIWYLPH